jgi:hypothetical protein
MRNGQDFRRMRNKEFCLNNVLRLNSKSAIKLIRPSGIGFISSSKRTIRALLR